MVTLRDVAERAGVTKQTVSDVATGRVPVRPATEARVRAAIAELGYVPNLVARSLATGSTRTVGLFVPTVRAPFYAELVAVLAGPAHGVRVAGFRRAFEEGGIALPDSAVHLTAEPTFRSGLEAAAAALRAAPDTTALFATHDLLAAAAVEAARTLGLSVPDDLSVVAHDDTPEGLLSRSPLASVVLPKRDMARQAVEVALGALDAPASADPRPRLLRPELVLGDSTRRAPAQGGARRTVRP